MSKYDFATLSPLDFEDLVRDLFQAENGVTLESFATGRDGGIDFRIATDRATCIVQAKHYSRSGLNRLLSSLKREATKVSALKPTRYILATSVSLTPQTKTKVAAALLPTVVPPGDIWGLEQLNNLLTMHEAVERKHFKLWLTSTAVLDQLIHSGIYSRTQTEIESIKKSLPRFVSNASVPRAEQILEANGSLIISGEPGVGKSTLARVLLWLHASQGWEIIVIDDIAEAFEITAVSKKRILFFDDFLGQVRLSPDTLHGIDQRLPPFLEKVGGRKDLRFVLTTRDYILHQAQLESARLSGAKIKLSELVLNVGTYTRSARAKILYNHLYFSDLSSEDVLAVVSEDFFLKIIDHPNFSPRLIELLTNPEYLKLAGLPITEAIASSLANPTALWAIPYRKHMTADGRIAMLALLFCASVTPISQLRETFEKVARALEHSLPPAEVEDKFRSAIREIEGSVLAIQDGIVRFANPGVRDFLISVVLEDKLLDRLLREFSTTEELKQAWGLTSNKAHSKNQLVFSSWAGALTRAINTGGSAEALTNAGLALSMDEYFETDESSELLSMATGHLASSEYSDLNLGTATAIMEDLGFIGYGREARVLLHQVVSELSIKAFEYDADTMSLEDMETTALAIHSNAYDPDRVFDAVAAVLPGLMDNLDNELRDQSDESDVQEIGDKALKLFDRFSVTTRDLERLIDERLQVVRERRPYDHDRAKYSGHSSSPQARSEMTTDEIRSLFAGLSDLRQD